MTERPKIMIVEDQMLIAYELTELLQAHDFDVLGPFSSIDEAKRSLESVRPDAALLDINLGGGQTSEALADILIEQKTPFAFLSGYRSAGRLAERFQKVDLLRKPARKEQLISLASALVADT